MAAQRKITFQELSQHRKNGDCWLAIHGKVYDVSKFMDDHPGGPDVLLDSTAKDASSEFDDIGHSQLAEKQMAEMFIGVLDGKAAPASAGSAPAASQTAAQTASPMAYILPLLVVIVAIIYLYTQN